MLVRKKPPKHKEKVRLGNALYAYHRTWTEGKPFTDYYFTAKKHPKVGHNIYVISGDEQKKPEYFLEGLYVVSGIGRRHKNKRKLLLTPLIKYRVSVVNIGLIMSISVGRFTSGGGMSTFPLVYEK